MPELAVSRSRPVLLFGLRQAQRLVVDVELRERAAETDPAFRDGDAVEHAQQAFAHGLNIRPSPNVAPPGDHAITLYDHDGGRSLRAAIGLRRARGGIGPGGHWRVGIQPVPGWAPLWRIQQRTGTGGPRGSVATAISQMTCRPRMSEPRPFLGEHYTGNYVLENLL
jgi:hypothetical protein